MSFEEIILAILNSPITYLALVGALLVISHWPKTHKREKVGER